MKNNQHREKRIEIQKYLSRPRIKNLFITEMRVKKLRSLNIIKLDKVKQNYTETKKYKTTLTL